MYIKNDYINSFKLLKYLVILKFIQFLGLNFIRLFRFEIN